MKDPEFNENSRRAFIKNSALVGLGLSASAVSSCKEGKSTDSSKSPGILNEKSKKLMEMFNLKYPIFQAPPGGFELAKAVANAGAMGAISNLSKKEEAIHKISMLQDSTNSNYYANYLLHFGADTLADVLKAGCKTIEFSFGIPTMEMVNLIRSNDAKFGIQVSSKQNAQRAIDLQPDFLFAQGLEAGGHIQASMPLRDALREVLDIANDIPVLVAGEISTGHDMREAIDLGAAGAVLGTRFIATKESDSHDYYKNRILEAKESSTVYTHCFNREWDAMHRTLRNSTFETWEAEGCPLKGNKPGEEEIVANHPEFGPTSRYSAMPPAQGHTGDMEALIMYAGEGVPKITNIPSAKELVERLWREFENKE